MLPLLAVCGLLVAIWHTCAAAVADGLRRPILLVADESSFDALAGAYNVAPASFLREVAGSGVGAVAVSEVSLASLAQGPDVQLIAGSAWMDDVRIGTAPRPPFPLLAGSTYVLVSSPALSDWLAGALPAALGPSLAVRWYRLGDLRVAAIDAGYAMVAGAPLGFQPGSFSAARQAGLAVVPRLEDPFTGLRPAAVSALYAQVARAGVRVAGVIFAGPAWVPIPGGPAAVDLTARLLSGRGWPLGVVELPAAGDLLPVGMSALAAALPARVSRVQSVPALAAFTPSETWRLAQEALAGGIGVLYLRPVVVGADPLHVTALYLRSLSAALSAHGLRPAASPWTPPAVGVPSWQRVVFALAAVSSLLWLIELIWPGARRSAHAAVLAAAVAAGLVAAGPAGAGAVGIAGEVAAYGLSTVLLLRLLRGRRTGSLWARAALGGVAWTAVGAAGGLFAGAGFATAATLLGWPGFGGAAVGRVLALLCAAAAYLAATWPNWAAVVAAGVRAWRGWSERPLGLHATLRVWQVGAAACALAALYVLHRHGISVWVYDVRAPWMAAAGRLFADPPSEAAVLIGYPAVFLAAWSAARGRHNGLCAAVLFAALGQGPVMAAFTAGSVPTWLAAEAEAVTLVLGVAAGTLALAVATGVEAGAARLWPPAAPRVRRGSGEPPGLRLAASPGADGAATGVDAGRQGRPGVRAASDPAAPGAIARVGQRSAPAVRRGRRAALPAQCGGAP